MMKISSSVSKSSLELEPESENEYPELEDLVPEDVSYSLPENKNIMDWIGEEYRNARGFGLASIGPSILPTIWQEQSKKWEGITLNYISDIVSLVQDFVYRALAHLCPDESVRSGLWAVLQDQLIDKYRAAIGHVKFIIQVERCGTPLTTNHYFNENLQKKKSRRLEKLLEKHAEESYNVRGQMKSGMVVNLNQIQQTMTMGNADHTIQDIHDNLESYYNVARKRFVDTVCMQAIYFHLLTGESSPLRLFSTNFVGELSESQLDLIAGEDVSTKQLRKDLEKEIAALEKGKKLLRM